MLPELGLSLQLWCGAFAGTEAKWLRSCDANGNRIPTGAERANAEVQHADQAETELEQLRVELRRLQSKI